MGHEITRGEMRRQSLQEHHAHFNSGVSHSSRLISTVIQFDVAVTVERGKTGGGTAAIRIAVVEG
jgi:hypothetical protein